MDKSALIKKLIDLTPIAYVILDRNYRILSINKSFAELRNLDLSKTIGKTCYQVSNGGRRCQNCAVAKAIATGSKAFLSRRDTLSNGAVRYLDDYAIPLQKDEAGNIIYVLEIMIDRTREMILREQRNLDYMELVRLFSALLDAKDAYTANHSEHVRLLSMYLAADMGLSWESTFDLSVAASLHDIGKLNIPDSIISKPGKLSSEEYRRIQTHPAIAYDLLNGLSSFQEIRSVIRQHHERPDGKGYPDGLIQDEISQSARMIAVADTYDAITTSRSYQKARSHEEAAAELKRVAGTQLDGEIVEIFLNMDFEKISGQPNLLLPPPPSAPLERILQEQEGGMISSALSGFSLSDIDMQHLMDEIFLHTPCGYLLLDSELHIYHANRYFLEYWNLKEKELIGSFCFETLCKNTSNCGRCPLRMALHSKNTELTRQDFLIEGKRKIFDQFGIPLFVEGSEFLMAVFLDRTAEILSEEARAKDFHNLTGILETILETQTEQHDLLLLSSKIAAIKDRLHFNNCI